MQTLYHVTSGWVEGSDLFSLGGLVAEGIWTEGQARERVASWGMDLEDYHSFGTISFFETLEQAREEASYYGADTILVVSLPDTMKALPNEEGYLTVWRDYIPAEYVEVAERL